MLRDALTYPQSGPGWLWTLIVGRVLTLRGAVTFVPLIPVQGYLLRVLQSTAAGDPNTPNFREWPDLFLDGAKAIAVQVAYAFVPVALAFAGLAVSGFGVFSGIGGTGVGRAVEVLGWGLMALSVLAAVAAVYLVPGALTRLATTGRLGAAFDLPKLARAGRRPIYVVAVVEAYVALLVVSGVGSVLTLILIGAFFVFYGQVVAYHVFARGYVAATSESGDPATPDAAG